MVRKTQRSTVSYLRMIHFRYNDTVELFEAIVDCWQNIDHIILANLVGSMQKRCIAVLQKNEGRTSY